MNTEVGCHFLLQGILPTQGLNLCLLHWQAGSLPLSHQGSPPAQLDMGLNTENLLFLIIERTRIGQGSSDQDSDSVPLGFWFCWLTAVLYSFTVAEWLQTLPGLNMCVSHHLEQHGGFSQPLNISPLFPFWLDVSLFTVVQGNSLVLCLCLGFCAASTS